MMWLLQMHLKHPEVFEELAHVQTEATWGSTRHWTRVLPAPRSLGTGSIPWAINPLREKKLLYIWESTGNFPNSRGSRADSKGH